MKRIVGLKSGQTEYGTVHYINLENFPLAAVFTEPDGDIIINNDILIKSTGLSIQGEAIQCVVISPARGEFRLLLHYSQKGMPVTHVLGEIERQDLKQAKIWIQRVNKMYLRAENFQKSQAAD